jgi:mitochondrial fission protein ELM1
MDEMPRKVLILSDGKPGHVNQSIAFAGLLGMDYEIRTTGFRTRAAKALSYLLDRVGIYTRLLFRPVAVGSDCCALISTGSETYYANRTLARRYGLKSVAIMLPKGYRLDFDLILAQEHDDPPPRGNILPLPINLCRVQPQEVVRPGEGRGRVAVIIGGNSKSFRLEAEPLRQALEVVFRTFPGSEFLLTTSRRTPPEIEEMVQQFPFDQAIIYSKRPVNPIPDFLSLSDHVFLTGDSSSMVSEAVSFGSACVEVLPVRALRPGNKIERMVTRLASMGCLHVFDGEIGHCRRKIDLNEYLQGISLCG